MKRIVFAVIWFLVFYVGSLAVVGGVRGVLTYQESAPQGLTKDEVVQRISRENQAHGYKYSFVYFLGALVLSIGGTVSGILPGTKKRIVDADDG